ncbi:hypothetical protein BDR07DRAFT_1483272 [Suillus spraguei]|nr:hypothetical protein BDR07DRAFT_1483272 [Suillus spraguei]
MELCRRGKDLEGHRICCVEVELWARPAVTVDIAAECDAVWSQITIPYKRAIVGLHHFSPFLSHTIMSLFAFNLSVLAAPAPIKVQTKLTVPQDKLDGLILSTPDDKEELLEEKDIWVKSCEKFFHNVEECRREGAAHGLTLGFTPGEVLAENSIMPMVNAYHMEIAVAEKAAEEKKLAAAVLVEPAVADKGKGKKWSLEEEPAVEDAAEGDSEEEEEEEEAPAPKKVAQPSSKSPWRL